MKTLKDFAIAAGVTTERCESGWGGTWAYRCLDSPGCVFCGYKTEQAAYKAWAVDTFGKTATKALLKLLGTKCQS